MKELSTQNPNTVFVSAGDNVGGTPFTSFIAQDEPTIRALTAAGLEVSSVGNHEFDRGSRDLTTAEYVEDLVFADQLQTAREVADRIAADVDITVVLTHDGSPSTDCAAIAAETSSFGNLVRGLNDKVDAVFSGHTHTAYACNIDGLPVVSSGFYGGALSQVTMGVDPVTHEVQGTSAALIPLVKDGEVAFPADPVVAGIVADAVAAAEAPPAGVSVESNRHWEISSPTSCL